MSFCRDTAVKQLQSMVEALSDQHGFLSGLRAESFAAADLKQRRLSQLDEARAHLYEAIISLRG